MTCASTLALLDRSRESLQEAYAAVTAGQRHGAAQRSALCAAAALLAARAPGGGACPRAGGAGPQDPWALLRASAPELREWADFFAVSARLTREEPGARISARAADDHLRDAEFFVDLIAQAVGLPRVGLALPHRLPAVRESA